MVIVSTTKNTTIGIVKIKLLRVNIWSIIAYRF
jgi:hypothetical protein